MVTTAEALRYLAPTGRPLIDYVTVGNTITYWNTAVLGTQPSGGDIAAVTQAQADQAANLAALRTDFLLADNLLINGGFDIWQRYPTGATLSSGSYVADRWYELTQSGSVAYNKVSGLNSPDAIQLSQPTTPRSGILQVTENINSLPYLGRTLTLQCMARGPSVGPPSIGMAILEWTGTADSVTKTVVNDWTSTTYTPGNFFAASNLAVSGVSVTQTTDTYQKFSVTATIGTSCKNLIVFLWMTSPISNTHLDICEVGLYESTVPVPIWTPRHIGQELSLCQRYYQKSYNILQATGKDVYEAMKGFQINGVVSTDFWISMVALIGRMRTAPTITLYDVNTGGGGNANANKIGYVISAAIVANKTGTADLIGESGFRVYTDNTTVGKQGLYFHYVADAEL